MTALGFAVLLLLAGAAFIVPWRRGGDAQSSGRTPLAIYREQLDEVARDAAAGKLNAAEAREARLEIERRILRAGANSGEGTAGRLPVFALAGFALVLLAGAGVLYMVLGTYGVPAQPGQRVRALDQPIQQNGPSFATALAKIRARLAEVPDDRQGWELLARTASSVGAHDIAAEAAGQRARLGDPAGQWKVQQLEAYLAITGGRISPAARLLMAEIAATHPGHPAPDFYAGLAALQAGDQQRAYEIWQALADRSAPDAPWMERLAPQLAFLRRVLRLEPAPEAGGAADTEG